MKIGQRMFKEETKFFGQKLCQRILGQRNVFKKNLIKHILSPKNVWLQKDFAQKKFQ